MNRASLKIFIFFLMFDVSITLSQSGMSELYPTVQDSVIDSYSVEELLKYRDYYQSELNMLEDALNRKRMQGIDDAQHFIETNPDSKILDKIYMRLAEFYYDQIQEDYINAMSLPRTAHDTSRSEPTKDYTNVIQIYEKIICDYPQSELLDDAMFSLAYIYEEMGEVDKATRLLSRLTGDFPTSRYVPDAYFRLAEFYLNPPHNDIEKSIELYERILEFKDSPRYNEALYRLGWSYYRLNQYADAVFYFTLLADDAVRMKAAGRRQNYKNLQLGEESIEYIGISFVEYGGAKKAVAYLKEIGGRDYGFKILKIIGDSYKIQQENYQLAIDTYQILLKLYPDDPQCPEIMESIVECYQWLRDDVLAYLTRDKLYETYKPGTDWWDKNESKTVRRIAHKITERSLRDNINLLYQKALAADDIDLFRQAAEDSKKYLKSFPGDTNSAQIHWNLALTLDTKLSEYAAAFDEYMKISDLYWGSHYQRFAADNVIALARDAVAADSLGNTITTIGAAYRVEEDTSKVISTIRYHPISFTSNEQKLIRAYDNYIKLFPHEAKTADILTSAGVSHFNKYHFREALKYFNSKVKHFPESADKEETYFRIMESYFGNGDYKSCEIIARKILKSESVDSVLAAKSKNRLAESIFLSAEILADSLNYLAAGNEHLRVVKEVPDAAFADLSIFRAAREFDKAKEYRRAIETYHYLLEIKPDSRYKTDAMNNLALDYGEISEHKNAAITFERLSAASKDSLIIHDALYNSSIFYVRAEQWDDAIRVNDLFVNKFPDSEGADELFFDMATYYLKLNKLELANKIYGDYVSRFPGSPRVVETHYHRGNYYRKLGEYERAAEEYALAVQRNDDFVQSGIASGDFFAAEALFNRMMIRFDDYNTIQLQLPEPAMKESKERKKRLLSELIDGFSKVLEYGTVRLYESTYYIGHSYEKFADAWVSQELAESDVTRRIAKRKEIREASEQFYERAVQTYKRSLKTLTTLADIYEADIMPADSEMAADEEGIRYVSTDSTLRVARKWIERCKEKVSELIYDIAELNAEVIQSIYDAPVPLDLTLIETMEYKRQLLKKGIEPLLEKHIAHHLRNIEECRELRIENRWVKSSRDRVLSSSIQYGDRHYELVNDVFRLYRDNWEQYERSRHDESADGDLSQNLVMLIELSKILMLEAQDVDRQSLRTLRAEGISDPQIHYLEERMVRTVHEFVTTCEGLIDQTRSRKKEIESEFYGTKSIHLEKRLFTYEDIYLSIREAVTTVLEKAYEQSRELVLNNRWTVENTISLVKLAPKEYIDVLNSPVETMVIDTDSSWLISSQHVSDWNSIDFDDDGWNNANLITPFHEYSRDSVYSTMSIDETVRSYTISDSVVNTGISFSPEFEDDSSALRETKRIYLRKSFDLNGLSVAATLTIETDEAYNLFMNGEYIASHRPEDLTPHEMKQYELAEFLVEDVNVIAIEVITRNQRVSGLQARLVVDYLPDWDRERQLYKVRHGEEIVRDNLFLDKYIIIN